MSFLFDLGALCGSAEDQLASLVPAVATGLTESGFSIDDARAQMSKRTNAVRMPERRDRKTP
jgi:hypothetical protein